MIRFGPYQLDPVQGLKRGQREVRLTPRSLAVLSLLAGQPGRVVSKEELFATVWQDTAVTDSALATCIQEIRRALGDRPRDPRFVETLHRRGYRFVARTIGRIGDRTRGWIAAPGSRADRWSSARGRPDRRRLRSSAASGPVRSA